MEYHREPVRPSNIVHQTHAHDAIDRNLYPLASVREKPCSLSQTLSVTINDEPIFSTFIAATPKDLLPISPIRRRRCRSQKPSNRLMEEASLDAFDSLQHLFSPDDSDELQPPAPSLSSGDQIVTINFASPIQQAEESYRTITLSLFVDPSPGCGGIAWPAGEVGSCASSGCRLPPLLSSFSLTFIDIMTRHHDSTCVIDRCWRATLLAGDWLSKVRMYLSSAVGRASSVS